MKASRIVIFFFLFGMVMGSCKNQEKEPEVKQVESTVNEVEIPEKKELTEQDKSILNSVFSKVMTTVELKTFARASVTANLAEMLSKEKGPYTVFAPSNKAFEALTKEQMNVLQNPAKKQDLVTLLKSHIIPQNLTSADIVQSLKNQETLEFKAMAGNSLKIKKDGMDLWVEDASGNTTKIGKSDILGGNGVVHVIDSVLTIK